MTNRETQRLLNECADEVEPQEPVAVYIAAAAAILALSAAGMLWAVYFAWRVLHG